MNAKRKMILRVITSMAERNLDENGNVKIVQEKGGILGKAKDLIKDAGSTLASFMITQKDLDAIMLYLSDTPLPENASLAEKNTAGLVAQTITALAIIKNQRTKEYKKQMEETLEREREMMEPITDTIEGDEASSSELEEELERVEDSIPRSRLQNIFPFYALHPTQDPPPMVKNQEVVSPAPTESATNEMFGLIDDEHTENKKKDTRNSDSRNKK